MNYKPLIVMTLINLAGLVIYFMGYAIPLFVIFSLSVLLVAKGKCVTPKNEEL